MDGKDDKGEGETGNSMAALERREEAKFMKQKLATGLSVFTGFVTMETAPPFL